MNFSCLLCYQSSATPVCQCCENDIFFFVTPVYSANLLTYGPVGRHVRHSAYQRLAILSIHTYPMTTLIHGFKFRHSLTAGHLLSQWFIEKILLGRQTMPQLLLPVPISPWRFAVRHFNQAGVLAHHIGKALNIPICPNWAIRRGFSVQHTLGKQERLRHASRIFSLTSQCIDQYIASHPSLTRVAIVDDVVTTGVTADVLATMLRKRYHQLTIDVWAMTFTPPPKSSLFAN